MEKMKNLVTVFSKITICVLFAAAIYITAFWGWDARIGVMILWQILLVSAICSIPVLMYPASGEKELSKKGMIVRQIIYFLYVNGAVLGLGHAFEWFSFQNPRMAAFMELLIIGVYGIVNAATYFSERRTAEKMNQKLAERKKDV